MGLGVKQLKQLAAQSLGCCGCGWGGERLCRCRSRLLSAAPQIASNQKQGASFPQVALIRKQCASSWNLQWWTNQIRIKSGTWYENLVTRGHYRNSVCIVCFHLQKYCIMKLCKQIRIYFHVKSRGRSNTVSWLSANFPFRWRRLPQDYVTYASMIFTTNSPSQICKKALVFFSFMLVNLTRPPLITSVRVSYPCNCPMNPERLL